MSEKARSNRDEAERDSMQEIKEAGIGTLIAELIEFGNPRSIWNTGAKQKLGKKRHQLIVDELNRREKVMEDNNNKVVETFNDLVKSAK